MTKKRKTNKIVKTNAKQINVDKKKSETNTSTNNNTSAINKKSTITITEINLTENCDKNLKTDILETNTFGDWNRTKTAKLNENLIKNNKMIGFKGKNWFFLNIENIFQLLIKYFQTNTISANLENVIIRQKRDLMLSDIVGDIPAKNHSNAPSVPMHFVTDVI